MPSPFTQAVYDVVTKIPKGETRSYQEVAVALGKPKAYRAVASALRKNYNPDVPCHRVIHADGRLGQYNRGGTEAKKRLLTQEGAL